MIYVKVKLNRSIEIYDKKSDELVCEYPLKNVSLSFLQNLFGEAKTDLMLEVYKLNPLQVEKLEPFIDGKIDTEKYDCFLACYAA